MGGELMGMGRHLIHRQRDGLEATDLAEVIVFKARALTRAIWDAAAEVRQSKGGLAVPSISRAEERKECRILGDGQDLASTESPPARCEVIWDKHDLTEEWFGHESLLL